MNVSPAVLLLSVAIGVPLLLLALGVLYHAWVLGRQQSADDDDLGAHVEALATESTDALLIDLRDAVEHMQGQLARQRESLAGLLSEDARAPRTAMAAVPAPMMAPAPPTMPRPLEPDTSTMHLAFPDSRPAAGSFITNPRLAPAPPVGGSLTSAVADLVAEGLSDRAIARQLHIGLEEVRMARMRVGR